MRRSEIEGSLVVFAVVLAQVTAVAEVSWCALVRYGLVDSAEPLASWLTFSIEGHVVRHVGQLHRQSAGRRRRMAEGLLEQLSGADCSKEQPGLSG